MKALKNKQDLIVNILASGGLTNVNTKDTVNAIAGVGSTVLQNLTEANDIQTPKAPTYETANTVEDLFSMGKQYTPLELSRKNGLLSGLSGGLSGASAGATFGGLGAAAGAVIGGLSGVLGASSYNKKAREAEKRYERNATNNFQAKNQAIESNAIASSALNYAAYGGQFDNGLVSFNNGGSHELNPYGGIPQGVGANGKLNMVEEGETKFNNYIFSDRLKMDIIDPTRFNLPKTFKNKSFAKLSKKLGEESKERPFDPISINGLRVNLNRLQSAQEARKQINELDAENNNMLEATGLSDQLFSEGGNIHIKPSKKGTFTAAATKHGMGVQAFASEVLANKDKYSSAMIKKANFARNAAKWHENGGNLNLFLLGGPDDPYYNPSYSNAPTAQPYPEGVAYLYPGYDAPVWVNKVNKNNQKKTTNTNSNANVAQKKPQVRSREYLPSVASIGLKNPGSISAIPELTSVDTKYRSPIKPQAEILDQPNNPNKLHSWMRYAPALTNLGLTISDMFQKPEQVSYDRIAAPSRGRYAQMKYFDRNPIVNAMNRRTNTTIDTLKNSSAGNRGTFMANAAVVGNQSQRNIGDALQKIQEDEYNRQLKVLAFNNQVDDVYNQRKMYADQYNARIGMQEEQINAANRAARRNAVREGISNIGTTLGQIGREELDRFAVSNMFGYDYLGRPINRQSKGGKLTKKITKK